MEFPRAYIHYLVHFHGDRDYFECHEILEKYWKTSDPGNRSSVWVGLIQLAVAQYHYRRGNEKGAKKLIEKSTKILHQNTSVLEKLGLNAPVILDLLINLKTIYVNGQLYKEVNLPITNQQLMNICKSECFSLGFQWCSKEDLNNNFLIHRHLFQDRDSVRVLPHTTEKLYV
ncbi:DUF309 domain-containing protein [Bacillus sp. FJAT-49736]|uniref:DUF309 domain-containing protein n=1 Tax=Bacillus sp. FJAT-49736 TaxID=2833582 RepID=UPI0020164E8D|nr:DUF309 domain-containing protein [Bacillus sp. FJAT-49736]